MRPDRLEGWLKRNAVGAAALQLRHDQVGGGSMVFQRWPIDRMPKDPADLVQTIFDVAGDYADGIEENARIAIEFVDDDGDVLASTVHKAKTREAQGFDAANADNVSTNTIVSQLLRHIEVQQKVLSGGNLGAFQVLERALTIQNRLLEKQSAQLAQLADQIIEMRKASIEAVGGEAAAAIAADTEEESRARARALERVTELAPLVAEGFIGWMRHQAAVKAGMNGAAGAVHAAAAMGEV